MASGIPFLTPILVPSGQAIRGFSGTTEVIRVGPSDIRVGETALNAATSVLGCVAVGDGALGNGAAGQVFNTAVGDNSLLITTGLGNTAIGYGAGGKVSSGVGNCAFGFNSLGNSSAGITGNYNIGLGSNTLQILTSGNWNIAVGHQALNQVSTGSYAVGIGYNAGYVMTASNNVAIGAFALSADTSGANNVALGYSAGGALSTNGNGTFIGASAGTSMTGANNTVVGAEAGGGSGSTSSDNTFVGYRAGYGGAQTSFGQNTLVGSQIGMGMTGSANTGMGYGAFDTLTSGTGNVAIGHSALFSISTATDNTALGSLAGENCTGSGNTFLGGAAGQGSSGSSGDNNVVVGYNAATGSAFTGDNNIVIGYGVNPQSFTASDQINVGNSFKRGADGNLTLDLGTGGTTVFCAGILDVSTNQIINVADATEDDHAVNKGQMDAAIAAAGGSSFTLTAKTDHYTLLTADAGVMFTMDSSSNKDFTVNGSLNLAVGEQIHFLRLGAGEVAIVASGATVNSAGGLKLRARYSTATLLCVATDTYVLIGDLKV